MTATFVPYEEGMNFLLRSEVGPLAMFIDRRARLVEQIAKRNVAGGGLNGRPHVRTQRLHNSVRYGGIITTSDGPLAAIGTDARSPRQNFNYPMALEKGMPAFARLPNIDKRGRAVAYATGRTQKPYRYPWLLPALVEGMPGFARA